MTSMPRLVIRPLLTFDELEDGVELQKKTWGRHFDDIVSAALMRVAQKIGGIAAGAFDPEEKLAAMVFGLAGLRDDVPVHWSHMLAVEPDYRGRGLGTVLKIYQRRRVTAKGVGRMYWTFDPLEARNAHFNINRLGVRIESYIDDMYGSGETSPIHRGIGTDRFVAFWPLRDPALQQRIEKIEGLMSWDPDGREATIDMSADMRITAHDAGARTELMNQALERVTGSFTDRSDTEQAFVEIPSDIQRLKAAQPEEASFWRTATRTAFLHYFSHGMTVTGFLRDPESGRCFYVMDPSSSARAENPPARPHRDHHIP